MIHTTPTTPDKSAPEKGMELRKMREDLTRSEEFRENLRDQINLIEAMNGHIRFREMIEASRFYHDATYPNKNRPQSPAQETGQQDADYEGTTPSSQKGGCDYMSFSDAKKLFQKYIDCEMRDPNGLDELAKAMLSYNRAISRLSAEKNYVGEEKKPAVFYCENGTNLEGLEQGALAVLSNLMIKTNATSADFMIGNEKDGKFYFHCSRAAPSSPREGVEALKREAVRWCLANANHMDLEDVGNGLIDHLHAQGHLHPAVPTLDLNDLQRAEGNKTPAA